MKTEFERKKDKALVIMEQKKVWKSIYAPPLVRLLWKTGINIPPPLFAPFWLNTSVMGGLFGVLWGIIMCFTLWSDTGVSVSDAVKHSALAGLLFGLLMATFYLCSQIAYKLPEWDEL